MAASPILWGFLSTLFTYLLTTLGAAGVFVFDTHGNRRKAEVAMSVAVGLMLAAVVELIGECDAESKKSALPVRLQWLPMVSGLLLASLCLWSFDYGFNKCSAPAPGEGGADDDGVGVELQVYPMLPRGGGRAAAGEAVTAYSPMALEGDGLLGSRPHGAAVMVTPVQGEEDGDLGLGKGFDGALPRGTSPAESLVSDGEDEELLGVGSAPVPPTPGPRPHTLTRPRPPYPPSPPTPPFAFLLALALAPLADRFPSSHSAAAVPHPSAAARAPGCRRVRAALGGGGPLHPPPFSEFADGPGPTARRRRRRRHQSPAPRALRGRCPQGAPDGVRAGGATHSGGAGLRRRVCGALARSVARTHRCLASVVRGLCACAWGALRVAVRLVIWPGRAWGVDPLPPVCSAVPALLSATSSCPLACRRVCLGAQVAAETTDDSGNSFGTALSLTLAIGLQVRVRRSALGASTRPRPPPPPSRVVLLVARASRVRGRVRVDVWWGFGVFAGHSGGDDGIVCAAEPGHVKEEGVFLRTPHWPGAALCGYVCVD
jgi:hypothetical protein